MAIDWTSVDLTFLRAQLELGRAILFAGAGFSVDATNRLGESPPLGNKLAELLATKASIPYLREPLPMVFDAVEPLIGANNLWKYLTELYSIEDFADWYQIASAVTWQRIYTTNIDNLFQRIAPYRSKQRINTIIRNEPPQERDQLFEDLQCIHLHGHVEHRANGLTFTPQDFAKHTARPDPWYQNLADDVQNCPVIFMGTTLEETILTHYLEIRDQRDPDKREWRPKSFLVSPGISPIRAAALRSRNIMAIDATGKEFFESLDSIGALSLRAVQVRAYPHLFQDDKSFGRAIANHFDLIVPNTLPPTKMVGPSRFFLGAEPTWNDISERRDADRCVNDSVISELLKTDSGFRCFALLGHAGSGKTTTIMRVAHELASQGKTVFFARPTTRLDLTGLLDLLEKTEDPKDQTFIIVDVVSQNLGSFAACRERLKNGKKTTLVLVERKNRFADKCQRLRADFSPTEINMPDLEESDVKSVIERLEKFGFLGTLKGVSLNEQVKLFMDRATRQLLVALREATSGKDFSLILQGEYEELERVARLAYTICCIAVSRGAPGIYTRHLNPCLPVSGFTKGHIISELLNGVLVPTNDNGTMVKPRHGLIAKWIALEIAPLEVRLEALSSFLKQVSSFIVPNQIKQRSPAYLAYRGMINSAGLKELLNGDAPTILSLYEELQPFYKNDFLFWLHYAMAHIDANNLDIAENYLNQSLALYPNSHQTWNHMGILYLKQATESSNPAAAQARADEGAKILVDQMRMRGDFDEYPYHAYLTHMLRWYVRAGDIISQGEWEALRLVGKEAKAKHRLADGIKTAADDVEFAYLKRAIHGKPADHSSEPESV